MFDVPVSEQLPLFQSLIALFAMAGLFFNARMRVRRGESATWNYIRMGWWFLVLILAFVLPTHVFGIPTLVILLVVYVVFATIVNVKTLQEKRDKGEGVQLQKGLRDYLREEKEEKRRQAEQDETEQLRQRDEEEEDE